MRKVLVIFFLIISFSSLNIFGDSFEFRWEENTTYIEVPLNANIQNYLGIPKVSLYRNGQKLEDANVNYITTGDWLFLLMDVDTTKAGIYQVWYKAVETKYKPGQCPGYKTLVTFNVIDFEPPVIKSFPEVIYHHIGNPIPEYLKQLIVVDNSGTCDVIVDDSLVNYNIPGEYIVIIRANDGYNMTTVNIKVIVDDPQGPIVTFLGENNRLTFNIDAKPEMINYFKAIDKIDGDVTSTIKYENFDTSYEHIFDLVVEFFDYSGNVTEYIITIEIINLNVPYIELYKDLLIIEFNTDYQILIENNLKRALLGNEDIREYITIDYSNLSHNVGNYNINYEYNRNGKTLSVSCTVKILSSNPPIILINNIETLINVKPNYSNYVNVIDESDPLIKNKIEFDDSAVNYQKAGTYPVIVSVINSSNLSSTDMLYVTVIETVEPPTTFAGENNFIYYLLGGLVILGIIGGIFFYLKHKKKLQ